MLSTAAFPKATLKFGGENIHKNCELSIFIHQYLKYL